jgi:hypothetical protein
LKWRGFQKGTIVIEQKTGVPIVSKKNAKDLRQLSSKKEKKKFPLQSERTLFDH